MAQADPLGARRALPPAQSALRRRTRVQIDWLDINGVRLRYGVRRGAGRPQGRGGGR